MGLFIRSSPIEKLSKRIDQEFWRRFNKIEKNNSFTNKQKKLLSVILACANVIGQSLIQRLKSPDRDLSEYIDKNVNPFEIFLFACYIQLSDIKERIKNKKEFSEKLGGNPDRIISSISNVLEIDGDTYFDNFFSMEENARKEKIDPRDIWLNQEVWFYNNKILKRNFNLYDYCKQDPVFLVWLSMSSMDIRIGAMKIFDRLISKQTIP